MTIVFFFGLLAAAALAWYGAEPWILAITSRGEQAVENPHWVKRGFALFGAAAIVNAVSVLGGWFGLLLSAGTNLSLFVGIPAAIVLSRTALKGAASRRAQAAIDEQRAAERAAAEAMMAEEQRIKALRASGPSVYIGQASGTFASLGHAGAAPPGKHLFMFPTDLAQSLVVFGLPGTGKTWLIIETVASFLAADRSVGAFVPCVKRDFADDVTEIVSAQRGGSENIYRVSPDGGLRWNLMSTLSPDAIAGFFRTTAERKGGGVDTTWIDASVGTVQTNALLLDALTDGGKEAFIVESEGQPDVRYGWQFVSLHRLCNLSAEKWATFKTQAAAYGRALEAKGLYERSEQIANAIEFRDMEFESLADRTRSSVLFNINAVLGPLVKNTKIRRTFATETDLLIDDLDKGAWILIDVDKDEYAGSYLFLILLAMQQFQGFALRRMGKGKNKVVLLGDEWHAWCTSTQGDLLALSRGADIVATLATQSFSKIVDAMGGSRERAEGSLATVGSKIFLPTDDRLTIEYAKNIADATEREFASSSTSYSKSTGSNTGSSSGTNHGPQGGGNSGWSSGSSEGESWSESSSTSIQQRAVVTGQTFRGLKSHFPARKDSEDHGWSQAVAFLRSEGQIADDIIVLRSQTTAAEKTARSKNFTSTPSVDVGMTCADAWGGK